MEEKGRVIKRGLIFPFVDFPRLVHGLRFFGRHLKAPYLGRRHLMQLAYLFMQRHL